MAEVMKIDLLESLLRSAKAEDYIENFRNFNVDVNTLPLLSDEDLVIIGVKDNDTRQNILICAKNLQISTEKFVKLQLTDDYVELVLNQISHQLNLHQACLTCAVVRQDVVVCDVPLQRGTLHSLNCLESFEKELIKIEKESVTSKSKKCVKILTVIASVMVASIICKKIYNNLHIKIKL